MPSMQNNIANVLFVSYFNFQQQQKEHEEKREEQNRNAISMR